MDQQEEEEAHRRPENYYEIPLAAGGADDSAGSGGVSISASRLTSEDSSNRLDLVSIDDEASLTESQLHDSSPSFHDSVDFGSSAAGVTTNSDARKGTIVNPQRSPLLSGVRILLIVICILGTIASSLYVYFCAERDGRVAFESAFEDHACFISNTWRVSMDSSLGMNYTSWESVLEGTMSPSSIVTVVKDNCSDETHSFRIQGSALEDLGTGDKHDTTLTSLGKSYTMGQYTVETTGESLSCDVEFQLYPTAEMEDEYITGGRSLEYVLAVVVLGATMLLFFVVYDCLVKKWQNDVTMESYRLEKVLTSLFPANVHERLLVNVQHESTANIDFDPLHLSARSPPKMVTLPETPETVIDEEKNEMPTPPVHIVTNNRSRLDSIGDESASMNSDSEHVPEHSKQSERRSGFLKRTPSFGSISGQSLTGDSKHSQAGRLRGFLRSNSVGSTSSGHGRAGSNRLLMNKDEPIADLFPDATVMFADISGFTAWSSEREPSQVFRLLETVYRNFDRIARKRRVFKVETIGDCYMAVTGLPDPMKDHAIVMAKFAKECMHKMNDLTEKLELLLGPGTSELRMRFGMNSGPVTAGVLRGEKSRFQLFGDTVNFASRMESTGTRNRIQASQTTADLLINAGFEHWVHPREELVHAKGKGEVQTYWVSVRSAQGRESSGRSLVNLKSRRKASLMKDSSMRLNEVVRKAARRMSLRSEQRRSMFSESQHFHNEYYKPTRANSELSMDGSEFDSFSDNVNRQERMIDWNVEILSTLLKQIVASREGNAGTEALTAKQVAERYQGKKYLEEVTEIIPLFTNSPDKDYCETTPETIQLPPEVTKQLREYVTMIACMYRDNFFHNFEHASHVLMSSQKLLKRVLIADQELSRSDYTRGITSDPLTQFAIVFSALIHDVDHTGVPNSQLVKEKAHVATLYNNKSVAEQNSLDLAWELLLEPNYKDLQRCIFSSQAELERFRQLIVNVVLATDIFDPDMKAVRNSRFNKAFHHDSSESKLSALDAMNLKATIVIEYIMQASDVSHTMQHWHIYQRWNERLFEEMYSAFQVNRLGGDPSVTWYKGELAFFDHYIIPLAKKLKDCEVFGSASDEFLNYALENRKEWERKGEEIVARYIANQSN